MTGQDAITRQDPGSTQARLRLAVRLLDQAHGLLPQPSAAKHRAALQALHDHTSTQTEDTLNAIAEARLDPEVTVAARRVGDTVRALRADQNNTATHTVAEALRVLRAALPRLQYERAVRETGTLIGRLWDERRAQPMLTDAWTHLPIADAYAATLTALATRHPRSTVDRRDLVLAYGLQQLTFALRYSPDDAPAAQRRAHRAAQTLALTHAVGVLTAEHSQSTLHDSRPPAPATPGAAFAAIQQAGRLIGEAVDAQHSRHNRHHNDTSPRYSTVWDTHHPDAAWQIMTTPAASDGTPHMLAHLPAAAKTTLTTALQHLSAAISAYHRMDWESATAHSTKATTAIHRTLHVRPHQQISGPGSPGDPYLQPPTTEPADVTATAVDAGAELT